MTIGKLELTYGCYSASGGKYDMRVIHKEGLSQVRLVESSGYNLGQRCYDSLYLYYLFSLKHDIKPTTESTVAVRPRRTD
jgi:hypothetical protein